MPVSTVAGHKGSFIFGNIENTKVAVMNGRVHLYEGYSVEQVVLPIRVLRLLGCETIIFDKCCRWHLAIISRLEI